MVCSRCSTAAAVIRESIELDLRGEVNTLVDVSTAQFIVETKKLLETTGFTLHELCPGSRFCDCQHKSPIKMQEFNQLAGLD